MYFLQETTIKKIIQSEINFDTNQLDIITLGLSVEQLTCNNNKEFVTKEVLNKSNIIVSDRNKDSLLAHIKVNNVLDSGIYVLVNDITTFKQYVQNDDVVLNSITYDTLANNRFIHDVADSIFSSMYTKNKKIVFAKDPKVIIIYNDPQSRYETTTIISKVRSKYAPAPNLMM